jgi:hypothetical protein
MFPPLAPFFKVLLNVNGAGKADPSYNSTPSVPVGDRCGDRECAGGRRTIESVKRITVSARRDLSKPWAFPADWGPNPRRARIGSLSLLVVAVVGGFALFWLILATS